MWVAIVTLLSLLAALGYLAFAARRLDIRLGSMLRQQREERSRIQQEVERLRSGEVVVTTSPGC